MAERLNLWLLAGGALSTAAAIMHLAIIVGGASWYRFFGAGERMAAMAEEGKLEPALITIAIATVLSVAAAYAFSGAGLLPRFPLLRTGLVVISAVYLLRGVVLVPFALIWPERMNAFALWSSLIVLVYGLTHAIGLWTAWPRLAPPPG